VLEETIKYSSAAIGLLEYIRTDGRVMIALDAKGKIISEYIKIAENSHSETIKKFLKTMDSNNRFCYIDLKNDVELPKNYKDKLKQIKCYLCVAYSTIDKLLITSYFSNTNEWLVSKEVTLVQEEIKNKYNLTIIETKNALNYIINKLISEEKLYTIFVEGTSDYYIIEAIFKKFYSTIFDEIKDKILFYPVGGINQLKNLIFQANFSKYIKHFMVITDRDTDNPDIHTRNHTILEKRIKEMKGHLKILHKREIECYIPPRILIQFYSEKGIKLSLNALKKGKIRKYLESKGIKIKSDSLAKFIDKYVNYHEFKEHTTYKDKNGNLVEEFKEIILMIHKDLRRYM